MINVKAKLSDGTVVERDYYVGSLTRCIRDMMRIAPEYGDGAIVELKATTLEREAGVAEVVTMVYHRGRFVPLG